jgi:ParB family transcriptional regulator, chromosome partitioning protein
MNDLARLSNIDALFEANDQSVVLHISLADIDPDPNQPRKQFDVNDDDLLGLAKSIKTEGVIKPIEVRQVGTRYILTDGERRCRASSMAGLESVPAIVRQIDDLRIFRRQVIANIHAKQMAPLEEAAAIATLVKDEGSVTAVADLIGKSVSWVQKCVDTIASPAAREIAAAGASTDVETLSTVASIERKSKSAAEDLVEVAKDTGKLGRAAVREKAAAVRADTAKSAIGAKPAPKGYNDEKPATAKKTSDGPLTVDPSKGEVLAVELDLVETAPADLKAKFQTSVDEHGDAVLYPLGVASSPWNAWVMFGPTAKTKKADQAPRLMEVECKHLVLYHIAKYNPTAKR